MKALSVLSHYPTGEVHRGKKTVRHNPIRSANFIQHEHGFVEWLKVLGKNNKTLYRCQGQIHEFLHYLETIGLEQIDQITIESIRSYIGYLKQRPNYMHGGSLSINTINGQIGIIKRFIKYLEATYDKRFFFIIKYLDKPAVKQTVLTLMEVMSLYDTAKCQGRLGQRDIVLLDLFYSCGLRRSEGIQVNIEDVDLTHRRLLIRRAKGYKQRYVPFTEKVSDHLSTYIEDCRVILCKGKSHRQLLISERGTPLASNSCYTRLQRLIELSKDGSLQSKQVGLHTLRHSIATHLSHAGMQLTFIANFLGHASMESTQIYTHLAHEL